MSPPRFLADENLRHPILQAARRLWPGIEIATVHDLGLAGVSDPDLLRFAQRQGWIVVSHDVNTMPAAAQELLRSGSGFAGLLLVPLSRPDSQVAESLILIAAASDADEWRDRIVFLPL